MIVPIFSEPFILLCLARLKELKYFWQELDCLTQMTMKTKTHKANGTQDSCDYWVTIITDYVQAFGTQDLLEI